MNESEESPGIKGLGLIDGSIKKFNFKNEQLKIPHVGWNTLDLLNENQFLTISTKLNPGITLFIVILLIAKILKMYIKNKLY